MVEERTAVGAAAGSASMTRNECPRREDLEALEPGGNAEKAGQKNPPRIRSVCLGGSEEHHEALKAFLKRYFDHCFKKSVFSAFYFHYLTIRLTCSVFMLRIAFTGQELKSNGCTEES